MLPALQTEITRALLIAGLAALPGAAVGYPALAALIALSLYLLSQARQLNRLLTWLKHQPDHDPPEAEGLWGEVFQEIYLLKREDSRHQAELNEMLGRFQDAAAALPDGMVILQQDNRIQWANPVACRMLGISMPIDSQQPVSNLIRDPRFGQYLDKQDYSREIELESPEQAERLLTLQLVPYGANQKLLMCRDITHIRKLEQMRTQFVGNVSHELRSPLTVLSGYLETLLSMSQRSPKDMEKALQAMHEQSRRMERLVTDLLALSRLETEPVRKHGTVDVPALLASLQESATLLSGSKQHVITLDAAPVKLLGSHDELHSLFGNLINNAVRYTPAGGDIRIVWKKLGSGQMEFCVSDTGPGIARQHLPRLTERFYRVDPDRSRESGGTGLGMAIVKHVLERHAGTLHIDSEIGKGSTFCCRFPAERAVQS